MENLGPMKPALAPFDGVRIAGGREGAALLANGSRELGLVREAYRLGKAIAAIGAGVDLPGRALGESAGPDLDGPRDPQRSR